MSEETESEYTETEEGTPRTEVTEETPREAPVRMLNPRLTGRSKAPPPQVYQSRYSEEVLPEAEPDEDDEDFFIKVCRLYTLSVRPSVPPL